MFQWPPRPTKAVMPDFLKIIERQGWICQVKKNGTCTVLDYDPATQKVQAWTRHGEAHKNWSPDLTTPCLRKLKELKGGRYQLVGELLHSKVPGIKDTLYLFDILIADGKSLVGTDYQTRFALLHSLWPKLHETPHYDAVDTRLWIATAYTSGFRVLFDSLVYPEDEGVVLKNPKAPLDPCVRELSNTKWNLKCRKPTANFPC